MSAHDLQDVKVGSVIRFARGLVNDSKLQALEAMIDAGELIWHSIQKYDGNPTHDNWHPINCGCSYCN